MGGGEQHKKKKTFKLLILQTMFTFVIKKKKKGKEEPCKKRFQHQSLFQTCDDGWMDVDDDAAEEPHPGGESHQKLWCINTSAS